MITVPTARSYPQPPTRESIKARCAQLTATMADLDPAGAAYAATYLRRDQCLDALFKLGPLDPWGDPD